MPLEHRKPDGENPVRYRAWLFGLAAVALLLLAVLSAYNSDKRDSVTGPPPNAPTPEMPDKK